MSEVWVQVDVIFKFLNSLLHQGKGGGRRKETANFQMRLLAILVKPAMRIHILDGSETFK
jgi:hypothetical protein